MKYRKIRQKYLDFLKSREHAEIENASLVPENDPSILFTPAGMSPIVPYLLGEKHPKGTKLVNIQRCIRTGDIDEVGDDVHLTFFEMAGNWSLNDYFKEEAIAITFSFFVEELGLDPQRLYGSVFEGNSDAPKDEVAIDALKKVYNKFGIEAKTGKRERIQFFGKDKCWWELPAGGPCGPCSEIFYDTGKDYCGDDCDVNCDCGKYVEIGNNVFMEYLKKGKGVYASLGKHNVDFGGGLARLAMLLQGVDSVFDIDIYKPIQDKVKSLCPTELAKRMTNETTKSIRVLTEHITTAVFILMDGVIPRNVEQGYILRRIIRRAIRHAKQLGIPTPFTVKVAKVVVKQWKDLYPQLVEKEETILSELVKEEKKFAKTVEKGEKEIRKVINKRFIFSPEDENLPEEEKYKQRYLNDKSLGKEFFRCYETYGYPIEMSLEILGEYETKFTETLDKQKIKTDFDKAFKSHQEKSRAGASGKFKGGLADTSEESIKYHTATHLLNAALQAIIDKHIYQMGSNITPERLRFDYPSEAKLTPEQIEEVENWVNDKIEKNLPVTFEEMTPELAKQIGAQGVFEHRYGDIVKVYEIGDKEDPVSLEICKGPHVDHLGKLGHFKIIKQDNVSAGVKRIKAILE